MTTRPNVLRLACLPVVTRELRVGLRKKRPARSRLIAASVCATITLLFLFYAVTSGDWRAGRNLHQIFFMVGLFIVLRAPPVAAGVFAEERRNQTLGLLFLSGLGAGEVFVSKVLSSTLIVLTNLLAIFPMLALPFLIGGVSFDLFLATVFCLPNLLIFALAVTLLASVLTQDDGAAVVLASVLGVFLCATPLAIYFAQTHFAVATPSDLWLRVSPAYGPWLLWAKPGLLPLTDVWSSFGFTLGWSGLCLVAAAFALKRLWRDREQEGPSSPWRERWNALVHGTAERRRRLADAWLHINPFVWLAARDAQPAALAWAVVGGITGLWLLCWAVWRGSWPSVPNLFITAALLNGSLGWLIRHTAAKSLGAPRHDGTYELLLTTPLQPSDIVWGGLETLAWQFRGVARCVLALNGTMMLGGLALHPWNGRALFVYFVAWAWLLAWAWLHCWYWRSALLAMWAGLNCGRPALAVWRISGLTLSWLFPVLGAFWSNSLRLYLTKSFPSGSLTELFVAVTAVVTLAGAGASLLPRFQRTSGDRTHHWEGRLMTEFREIAREPLPEPDDPRFKEWSVAERFPWGWEIVQQQLHERLARR